MAGPVVPCGMTQMSDDLATSLDQDLRAAGGPVERARLLDEIVTAVYDYVKFNVPGGGFDGRDSDERLMVGDVMAAAHLHRDLTKPQNNGG